MTSVFRPLWSVFAVSSILVIVMTTLPQQASAALDSRSPNVANSSPDGAHVHFLRNNPGAGVQTEVNLVAWYPTGTNFADKFVQLYRPAGSADGAVGCKKDAAGLNTPSKRERFVSVTINSPGSPSGPIVYYVPYNNGCGVKTTNDGFNGSGVNDGNAFYAKYRPRVPSTPDPGTNGSRYRVGISIKYSPELCNTASCDTDSAARLSVYVPGASVGAGGSSTRNFPIVGHMSNTSAHPSIVIPFGLRCTINTPQASKEVHVYDTDDFPGQDLRYYVEQYSGGAWSKVAFDAKSSNTTFTGPGKTVIRPNPSTANATDTWGSFTMQPRVKYRLVVIDIAPKNVMSFAVPDDSIFGVMNCLTPGATELTPEVDIKNGSENEIEVGETAIPWAQVTNEDNPVMGNWQREFWYEESGDDLSNESSFGNQSGTARIFPKGETEFDNNANNGSNAIGPVVVPSNKKRICTSLRLTGFPPGTEINDVDATGTIVKCKNIVQKPYLSIKNGDLNTTCAVANTGAINAFWNSAVSGGGNGSGASLAMYAGGTVEGFASAVGRLTAPFAVNGLSFANDGAEDGYGLPFNGQVGACSSLPDAATMSVPPGDVTLGSSSMTTDVNAKGIVYVKGNLTIDGNLVYSSASTSAFSLSSLPYFEIVVSGNIYIKPNVTSLDGIYRAGGTIYTCATASAAPIVNGTLLGNCGNTLTVRGALQAKEVKYLRFSGTTTSLGSAAETFTYDPLVWLRAVRTNSTGTTGSGKFDAYTTMPPIL